MDARLLVLALSLAAADASARRLELSATKARPGDPILVSVDAGDRPKGKAGDVTLVFFEAQRGWQAVFALPLDDPPAEVKVELDGGADGTVTVVPHAFTEEPVDVPPEMAEPPPDKQPQVKSDNVAIVDAMRHDAPPLFSRPFRRPAGGKVTSPFGSWRTFPGGYRSRHLGVDLAARKGAPVTSAQRGKVTLVHDGFLTGGTVVVQHGGGIASTYFHLADIPVAEGQEIERGAIVGRVGLTGRTTGPHIHLGIRVPGGFVDPVAFLKLKLRPATRPAPR